MNGLLIWQKIQWPKEREQKTNSGKTPPQNTRQKSRDTRFHDTLVQNPLINHQRGEYEIVTSINGRNTCMWSSVTHVQIFPTQIMMASVKLSNWWLNLATTNTWFSIYLVSSNHSSRNFRYEPQALEHHINGDI